MLEHEFDIKPALSSTIRLARRLGVCYSISESLHISSSVTVDNLQQLDEADTVAVSIVSYIECEIDRGIMQCQNTLPRHKEPAPRPKLSHLPY